MAQKLDDFRPEALRGCTPKELYAQHRTDGIPFHAWSVHHEYFVSSLRFHHCFLASISWLPSLSLSASFCDCRECFALLFSFGRYDWLHKVYLQAHLQATWNSASKLQVRCLVHAVFLIIPVTRLATSSVLNELRIITHVWWLVGNRCDTCRDK